MRDQDEARRRFLIYDSGFYGSARWATRRHLIERGYGPGGRMVFGYAPPEVAGESAYPVTYSGARHLLTVAPNRSGKGISTCIPALLAHPGSAVVLDPRGEIACATAGYRAEVLRQRVAIYDPFNVICPLFEREPDRFNPVDALTPDSPTFFDDGMLTADALVMGEPHGPAFWSDESRAFLTGGGLQVAHDPRERGTRHLGRVRALMNMKAEDFQRYVAGTFEKDPTSGKQRLVRPGCKVRMSTCAPPRPAFSASPSGNGATSFRRRSRIAHRPGRADARPRRAGGAYALRPALCLASNG